VTKGRCFASVLLIPLLAACGASTPPTPEPTTSPSSSPTSGPVAPEVSGAPSTDAPPSKPSFTAGPGGFPMPKDATEEGPAPGGGGKIIVFSIPRGRGDVAEELRALVKADGWSLDSDETSPRGSIRMAVTKGGTTIKASVAGDETRSQLILTVP
jgi:hypothetical protein